TRWQITYGYSDGFGREVMKKVLTESGVVPQLDGAFADPRWVGTGRTVFDNKGNPVKQYEPFLSATHEYEDEPELVEWGVTPIMRYDALGRLIRTDLPSGMFSRVAFDPWGEQRFDPNDTVLESAWYRDRQALPSSDPEARAAQATARHANTPTRVHLDALGR